MDTEGRQSLVIGGRGSLGRAVTASLLEHGVVDHVWSVDRAPSTGSGRPGVTELVADIRDQSALPRLLDAVPLRVHTYVSVLGGEENPPVEPITDPTWPPPAVWDDITVLNTGLAYRLLRVLQPRLADGATVTHVSSIAATMPWVISPAYGAAKAALEHWTTSLAVLLAPRGIRVNAVRPGFVWSRQWAGVSRDEFDAVVADRVALAQFDAGVAVTKEQTAEDVAGAVTFLASPQARQLTGQFLDIDGGAALTRSAR